MLRNFTTFTAASPGPTALFVESGPGLAHLSVSMSIRGLVWDEEMRPSHGLKAGGLSVKICVIEGVTPEKYTSRY
jgi:hypothetical protein